MWVFFLCRLKLTCHQGGVVVPAGHPADWLAHADLLWRGGVALLPQADLALGVVTPHEQFPAFCDTLIIWNLLKYVSVLRLEIYKRKYNYF